MTLPEMVQDAKEIKNYERGYHHKASAQCHWRAKRHWIGHNTSQSRNRAINTRTNNPHCTWAD